MTTKTKLNIQRQTYARRQIVWQFFPYLWTFFYFISRYFAAHIFYALRPPSYAYNLSTMVGTYTCKFMYSHMKIMEARVKVVYVSQNNFNKVKFDDDFEPNTWRKTTKLKLFVP